MKKVLALVCTLLIFSCSNSKYNVQEKAVREQMKRMDGAAAYADKAEIIVTEIPAKAVYTMLSKKSEHMIANLVPCVSEECNHELHRHTVKKAGYDQLKAEVGNKMFYQAQVFVLKDKDTVVNSYMFFDNANTFIDFTPILRH
jgi:hypothetical protein